MTNELIWIIILTLLPGLELRASIPYGILATNISWFSVLILAVVTNILLGPLVYLLVHHGVSLIRHVQWINSFYERLVVRAQRKIRKAVDKWGELGVALFIGIPLPGSGVYTGALGSYVLGLGFRKFFIACIIGVIIAATLVTIITFTGASMFTFLLKSPGLP